MCMRVLPLRLFRVAGFAIAVLCAGAITPLLSQQQALDPLRAVPASAPNATLPGPRLAPLFQHVETNLPRSSAVEGSSLGSSKENHTIVISTLVLVLGIIIIVLLATN